MATETKVATVSADIGGGVFSWVTPGAFPVSSGTSNPVFGNSNSLTCTGFGFAIPSTAVIDGVVADLVLTTTGASAIRRLVQVQLWNGTNIGTAKSPGVLWGNRSEGGAADGWSASLTPAIVNSSTFGARLIGSINPPHATPPDATITVASVSITVHYTASSTTTGGGEESGSGSSVLRPDHKMLIVGSRALLVNTGR